MLANLLSHVERRGRLRKYIPSVVVSDAADSTAAVPTDLDRKPVLAGEGILGLLLETLLGGLAQALVPVRGVSRSAAFDEILIAFAGKRKSYFPTAIFAVRLSAI